MCRWELALRNSLLPCQAAHLRLMPPGSSWSKGRVLRPRTALRLRATWYSLAGTLMYEAGVPLKRAQEILGHASERTPLTTYTPHSMRRVA